MSFGQSLSGLNAAAQNLDVIGNNIANSATIGFKAGSASFADIFSNSVIGMGVKVSAINQNFSSGSLSMTGNQFDMAIDGPTGMFVIQNQDGAQFYTRNGQFYADRDNKIVNAEGRQLMGYAPGGTNLIGLTVPLGNIEPTATSKIDNRVNLDASVSVVPNTDILEQIGEVSLTHNGYTQDFTYRINVDGSYTWVTGGQPPAGNYTTRATIPGTPLAFDALGQTTDTIPLTGGNIAPTAGTHGTVFLDGAAYYYEENLGVYSWYADDSTATSLNPGDPGHPDNTSYESGAAGGSAVTISSVGLPSAVFPSGSGNIDYTAPVVAIAFDPDKPESYSSATPITVFDSLGEKHQLVQYYTKRPVDGGNSVWEVNFRLDGEPPAGAGMSTLTFDKAGRLINSPSGGNVQFTGLGATGSPAATLDIMINYAGSTQFGSGFTQNFLADGYSSGEYAGISIGLNGGLTANYTNGATKEVGTLALADFNNILGLRSVGGNAWVETSESGQPVLGTPGNNGLAVIMGQAVEESNVDISQELVNMIMAQRTYQANAQTIKTQDQMMQTLMALR